MMDSVSNTACHRCRHQKLKCSRNLPACVRCQKFKSHCTYPARLDRRRPRSHLRASYWESDQTPPSTDIGVRPVASPPQSSPHGTLRLHREPQNAPAAPDAVEQAETRTPHSLFQPLHDGMRDRGPPSTLVDAQSPGNWDNVSSELYATHLRNVDHSRADVRPSLPSQAVETTLPSPALGLSLLEIYFSRIYKAPILFHKPLLFQDYLAGTLPVYLVKGLFALASLFLSSPTDGVLDMTKPSELHTLSIFRSRGPMWAQTATEEAMASMATNPSLAACQALESLQIYWFGVGNSRVGDLCIALAYRCCSISGYSRSPPDGCTDTAALLTSELQRRCFWACWTSICVAGEPTPYLRSAWLEASWVPLPAHMATSLSGLKIQPLECMNESWSPVRLEREQPHRSPEEPTAPAAAALMKIVGVWASIQLLVRSCAQNLPRSKLDEMFSMAELARSTYDQAAPAPYRAWVRDLGDAADLRLLEVCDAVYHLAQMTLHSKAVPFFSGSAADPSIPAEVTSNSAKTILHHADQYAQLLIPYLDGRCDATTLCPMVGFGAFVAATVFLAVETFGRGKGVQERRDDMGAMDATWTRVDSLRAIIGLLDTLRQYWRALQAPFDRLCAATQACPQLFTTAAGSRTTTPSKRPGGALLSPADTAAQVAPQSTSFSGHPSSLAGSSRAAIAESDDPSLRFSPPQPFTTPNRPELPSYRPDVFGAYENNRSGFDRTGLPTEPSSSIPLLPLDMTGDDWWSLPMNGSGSEFEGLQWTNFAISESWSYLT